MDVWGRVIQWKCKGCTKKIQGKYRINTGDNCCVTYLPGDQRHLRCRVAAVNFTGEDAPVHRGVLDGTKAGSGSRIEDQGLSGVHTNFAIWQNIITSSPVLFVGKQRWLVPAFQTPSKLDGVAPLMTDPPPNNFTSFSKKNKTIN